LGDSPERVAKRLDRLTRYLVGDDLPVARSDAPQAPLSEVIAAAVERAPARASVAEAVGSPEERAGVILERIIETEDFLDIRYLEAGLAAARAVCRISIRDNAGRRIGFGTGSLVSPELVLTNHHVLPDASVAGPSALEFNYQVGLDGQPLSPKIFHLDPAAFFLADEERDFALVAVRAAEDVVAEFGFNRLIEAEGKAVVGEFVTIVQHPRGEMKQIALRENRIVDLPQAFMHYEADTEPGSSGSPVFNDQWEVVALHHASVSTTRAGETDGYVNEGIRVSRIIEFAKAQALSPSARQLVSQLAAPERIIVRAAPQQPPDPDAPAAERQLAGSPRPAAESVSVTVPLKVTVALGVPTLSAPERAPSAAAVDSLDAGQREAISVDPDYDSRGGYDPAFLGGASSSVPLPALRGDLRAAAATMTGGSGDEPHVLRYHHFSVVMNAERRLAFFTAVNIDGSASRRLKRERDRWFADPRIPPTAQTDEDLYRDNPLDRGHLVRRLDPAWGDNTHAAKLANDDTFHFTNCTPQHEDFNQNKTTWAGLEDYILENADNRDFKVSVLTGPVFAADDDEYRGIKLPRQYWKVVAMVKTDGRLSVTGYLLSQEGLLRGLEVDGAFSYGAYQTFQVPVSRIEALTGLLFEGLADADSLAHHEAQIAPREIESPADLVL